MAWGKISSTVSRFPRCAGDLRTQGRPLRPPSCHWRYCNSRRSSSYIRWRRSSRSTQDRWELAPYPHADRRAPQRDLLEQDVLVGFLGLVLVHGQEFREHLRQGGQDLLGDRNSGVGLARLRPWQRGRVETPPEAEALRGWISRQHALQLGGAGTGQAGDDDGISELLVQNLGMALEVLLEPKPVDEDPVEVHVHRHNAHRAEIQVGEERLDVALQRFDELTVAPIFETGLLRGCGHQGLRIQLLPNRDRLRRFQVNPSRTTAGPGSIMKCALPSRGH